MMHLTSHFCFTFLGMALQRYSGVKVFDIFRLFMCNLGFLSPVEGSLQHYNILKQDCLFFYLLSAQLVKGDGCWTDLMGD